VEPKNMEGRHGAALVANRVRGKGKSESKALLTAMEGRGTNGPELRGGEVSV